MKSLSLETFVFFEKFRECISNRDLERSAGFLKTPMPIFHPDGLKLVIDQNGVFEYLRVLFRGMNEVGVRKMFHSIDDISKQSDGSRVSSLLTLNYMDSREQHLRESQLRYFLDRDDRGLKIVMIDYKKAAFQQVLEENSPVEALGS